MEKGWWRRVGEVLRRPVQGVQPTGRLYFLLTPSSTTQGELENRDQTCSH